MRAQALVVMLLGSGIARAEPTPQPARHPARFALGISTSSTNDDAGIGYLLGLHVGMSRYDLGVELDLSHVIHDRPEGDLYIDRGGVTFLVCRRWSVLAACPIAGVGWGSTGSVRSAMDNVLKPLFVAGVRLAADYHFGGGLGMRVRADLRGSPTETRFVVDSMAGWTAPRVEAVVGVDVMFGAP